MKKTSLLFLILAWAVQVAAQDKALEKLKKELSEHPQQDSFRVRRLIDLSTFVYVALTERKKISEEALSISQKINYQAGECYALANIAVYKALEGNMKECDSMFNRVDSLANKSGDLKLTGYVLYRRGLKMNITGDKDGLRYLLKAEKIFENINQYRLLAYCQDVIAGVYQSILSNYPAAMQYLVKAKRSAETASAPDAFFLIVNDLGSLYLLLGDYDNALAFFKKATEEVKNSGGDIRNTALSNSMGEIYRLTGKYPEAIQAYEEAISDNTSLYNLEVNESNLADVYTRMNNLPLAFQFGFSSLAKAHQLGDSSIQSWIHGILARAYLKKGIPDSSIYYARPGLDMSIETGTIEYMRDNAQALSDAYAFKKDFANAYKYHRQYINYRDSMVNAEVRNRTAVLQYNSDLEKKQVQIAQLNQQKKAQQNFLISALIVLTLILITAALLLRNNRQKQKANKLLQKQKQEIDDKAHELSVQKDNLQQSYNHVELLSEVGRKITSSLSVEKIIATVYDNVNSLMDASVFGIGIYNSELQRIEFPATYEDGVALPYYYNDVDDPNRFAVICFKNDKEIIMGNLDREYKFYTQQVVRPHEGKQSVSLLYLPLIVKENRLGVITVQSFEENAYTDYHLFMLRNIAIYTAIALENAESYQKLNHTVDRLKSTQAQLIQSEKMASLGELTAGIAHEIQNPLNFVNNFSEINAELIAEMNSELAIGNIVEARSIAENIQENEQKILLHGKRADVIVKGMLQHSRGSNSAKELTDINGLCDEYLRLSYHGLRARDNRFNSVMEADYDEKIRPISVVPQDIGRVLLNMYNNAFYAVHEKKKLSMSGFEPVVSVRTKKVDKGILISVRDNGNGIPQKVIDKIFHPFFTTKPAGQGTGLGLSLSYDIVKAHGGEIKLNTKENEGTEFTIELLV